MATIIKASYRVTTPLFCSGAHISPAELRLPSFKGVLRFWWRALAWQRYQGEMATIKQGEDRIFGSTATGQSRVLMRFAGNPAENAQTIAKGKVLTSTASGKIVGEGARYLGYGVLETFHSKKNKTKDDEATGKQVEKLRQRREQLAARLREEKHRASLDPLDRELEDIAGESQGLPPNLAWLKAVEDGRWQDDPETEYRVLCKIKESMKKEKKWRPTSKKGPKKDKAHKRTLQVMRLMERHS